MSQIVIIHIFAYIIGSIPFSLIISRFSKGIDIRSEGSGNIGATNVLRVVGKREAIWALLGDVMKGIIPVLVAIFMFEDFWVATTAVVVVLGHVFPIFAGFKGGKGVATSLGALLVITPSAIVISFFVWLTVLGISRYVSLASILAALSMPLICLALRNPLEFTAAATFNAAIIFIKHGGNIKRIVAGTESKVF